MGKLHSELTGDDVHVPGPVAMPRRTEAGEAGGYTLALADRGTWLRLTSAGALTVTVPPDSEEAFATGARILWEQAGAGAVMFVGGAGVTLRSLDGRVLASGQYARGELVKLAANEWHLSGELTIVES